MTDTTRLAQEVLRLDEGATKGPWLNCDGEDCGNPLCAGIYEKEGRGVLSFAVGEEQARRNAEATVYLRANAPTIARAYLELLEENRRLQAIEAAVDYVRSLYPEDVFPPDSDSIDAKSAKWARMVCDNIKREAEKIEEEEAL